MSFRTIFILVLIGFAVLCGGLIVESGFFGAAYSRFAARPSGRGCILLQQTTETDAPATVEAEAGPQPAPPQTQLEADGEEYFAVGGSGSATEVPLGSVDPASGFMYRLVLSSRGAGIRTATFSEFTERGYTDPEPLTFMAPVDLNGREVLSMANRDLTLLDAGRMLRLDALNWRVVGGVRPTEEGGQQVAFEATIVDTADEPVLRLRRTYRLLPDTYLLESTLEIENLSDRQRRLNYGMTGPVGLGREGFRADNRKVIAGYRAAAGEVRSVRKDMKDLAKAETDEERLLEPKEANWGLLWTAAVNKYFAAIVVPSPDEGDAYTDWIAGRWGVRYDVPGAGDEEPETIGLQLSTVPTTLAPAGEADSARTYTFQVYVGPKDKRRFDRVAMYDDLGFAHTIDFMSCCCPAGLINPLAFGILGIMNWMYSFIGNYGIVIIILVFFMRLIMHPVTKKSQVSMSKMSKLAPRAEEIKKKYGNNKAEMNKRLMELYREQGASPIMGFLPMMVQMPIWVALWSAVYTSIDLRGAPFLPVWITDLSIPDALVAWQPVTIPLLGWKVASLNLLPLMMGVAFYLQQKLMPTQQAAASTNPQLAQQQKMMQIMLPLMFPVMLYNAPAGVNLYIMSSTFAGVIEQYVIRKHIREKEEQEAQGVIPATSKTGGKVKKKKPKPFYRY